MSNRVITISHLPQGASRLNIIGDGNCWYRSVLVALALDARELVHEINFMVLRSMVVARVNRDAEEFMFAGTDAGTKAEWVVSHSRNGDYADQVAQRYTANLLGVTIRVRVGGRIDTYNQGCQHSIDILMTAEAGVYNHFDVYTLKSESQICNILREFDSRSATVAEAGFRLAIANLSRPVAPRMSDEERAIQASIESARREEQCRRDEEMARMLAANLERPVAPRMSDEERAIRVSIESARREEQCRRDEEMARMLDIQLSCA